MWWWRGRHSGGRTLFKGFESLTARTGGEHDCLGFFPWFPRFSFHTHQYVLTRDKSFSCRLSKLDIDFAFSTASLTPGSASNSQTTPQFFSLAFVSSFAILSFLTTLFFLTLFFPYFPPPLPFSFLVLFLSYLSSFLLSSFSLILLIFCPSLPFPSLPFPSLPLPLPLSLSFLSFFFLSLSFFLLPLSFTISFLYRLSSDWFLFS